MSLDGNGPAYADEHAPTDRLFAVFRCCCDFKDTSQVLLLSPLSACSFQLRRGLGNCYHRLVQSNSWSRWNRSSTKQTASRPARNASRTVQADNRSISKKSRNALHVSSPSTTTTGTRNAHCIAHNRLTNQFPHISLPNVRHPPQQKALQARFCGPSKLAPYSSVFPFHVCRTLLRNTPPSSCVDRIFTFTECVIADTVTCDLGDDMCSGGSSVFPRHSTSLFVAVGLLGFVASSISAMAF